MPEQLSSINLKLPCLKQIDISGISDLFPLLNVAPNLEYLIIYFDCLSMLLDDESTCYLLQTRIIRLNVIDWVDIESDVLQRMAKVFRSLRHLVIVLKDPTVFIDDFVLRIISLWKENTVRSIDVKGSLFDEIQNNLRQWLINHSHIKAEDKFAIEYNEKWFDLWL